MYLLIHYLCYIFYSKDGDGTYDYSISERLGRGHSKEQYAYVYKSVLLIRQWHAVMSQTILCLTSTTVSTTEPYHLIPAPPPPP